MFEKRKAHITFKNLLKRPDIDKAYAMVGPEDSWYDTITKVHQSLAQIRQLPHEILHITSHDNLDLQAIYYPCENSKATVICAHGYTSHAEREWAFPGLFYHSLGMNVLIPYQRAHGLSQGKYIAFGALEHRDMISWADKINERIPDGCIIFHGLSMGGGIVLDLSDKEIKNVRCLISDAPNTSIAEFLQGYCGYKFKKNADKISNHLKKRFLQEFGVDAADFDGVQLVSQSKYPLLLAAGSNEKMEDIFTKLQQANPHETQVLILPGCNHGNGMYKQTVMFQDGIRDFIFRHIPEAHRPAK